MRLAAEAGVPVLPRGGGTALAGQTVGAALVLDFGKYMNRVLEIDPAGARARVQPGVRLDRLNRAAGKHGLQFGPDPATIRQCCLGGMIGNNSCGARSLAYGKTGDHVHSLDCVLHDGGAAHFGPVRRDALRHPPGARGRARPEGAWRRWSRSGRGSSPATRRSRAASRATTSTPCWRTPS